MADTCGLCGHTMTFDTCGMAEADSTPLCHADDHSCYEAWTNYNARPNGPVVVATWMPGRIRKPMLALLRRRAKEAE